MPPKVKVTKEEIVKTALEIVREQGEGALNARLIAARLGCSTQPIFSNFENMEQLRFAVIGAAEALRRRYGQAELERGEYPPYKASGMGYIRFAGEERELFKLLYMRDRREEAALDEDEESIALVQQAMGLSREEARLFHLEMWIFVHGIAVMIATDYLVLDRELISRMLTDCYQGLIKHLSKGGN